MKVRSEVLRGRPIEVEGRRLVPVARCTSGMVRRATIGKEYVTAYGGGFVDIEPLGLVEQSEDGERFFPISDGTGRALLGLLAAAVVIPMLLTAAVRLARRR